MCWKCGDAVAHADLARHADARERRRLEAPADRGRRRSPCVWRSRSTIAEPRILHRLETLVEGARRLELGQQRLRHRLAGLGVAGEPAQHLRLLAASARRAARAARRSRATTLVPASERIGHVGQQAVQAVAELVEQRAGVVERQQRRLARCALGEVHDVDDDRPRARRRACAGRAAAHPGARALRRPREVVAEEQADVAAVRVLHLEGAHVRMIDRHVLALA